MSHKCRLRLDRNQIRISRCERTPNAAVANRSETKVAVIGGSGYAGEELVRLLLQHPYVDLAAVTSRQFAGKTWPHFPALFASPESERSVRRFGSKTARADGKNYFSRLAAWIGGGVRQAAFQAGARVVDLSADFRVRDPTIYKEFYGDDHPAPDLFGQGGLWIAGDLSRRNSKRAVWSPVPVVIPPAF